MESGSTSTPATRADDIANHLCTLQCRRCPAWLQTDWRLLTMAVTVGNDIRDMVLCAACLAQQQRQTEVTKYFRMLLEKEEK